jgi:hypothetical protein
MKPRNLLSIFSCALLGTLFICPLGAIAQIADSPAEAVAGIPVNYTEANVGRYSLPEPLKLASGERVTTPTVWTEKRRREILQLLEEHQFGRAPGRPADMTFDVFDQGTPAFDGKATRKQVTIYFTKDKSDRYVDLLIYLPASASGPVPLLLNLGWSGNNLAVSDAGVKVGRRWVASEKRRIPSTAGRAFDRPTILPALERGFGFATFNYTDIEPDALDSIQGGIRAAYLKEDQSQPAPDEWGAIAAWAWGVSRMVDYCETDPSIDAKRIAIMGVSRLGKTVLWAGARDERIALVLASCSGEGGAALSRRNYGETIAHLVAPTRFPYQFAQNYQKWAADPNTAPFDSHLLLSLIAPRPLLLQTGTTDKWSDPYGEFLAARAAQPVYALLGKQGVETDKMPSPDQSIMNTLGFHIHEGGHGMIPSDWDVFLKFMEAHLKK